MKLEIIRHGKVDMKWKNLSSSSQFDTDCKEYDNAPLVKNLQVKKSNVSKKIYVSTLSRSIATAELLFGERELMATELLNEVPLHSSINTNLRLPIWFWNLSGRIQWFFNSRRQQETRNGTIARADAFIEMLLQNREDCIIVTHGFYMHVFIKRLKAKGFKISKGKLRYENLEKILAVKE